MESYLIGNHELLDEKSEKVQLDYYLVEENRDKRENHSLYGIQITKKVNHNGLLKIEEDTTPPLSYSKEVVEQIIAKLIKGCVTPMSLVEIVDDMMSCG